MRVCPICEKQYDSKDRKVTYIKITTEHGFDTIKMIRTCSWACKTKLEERIRNEFQESDKLQIGEDKVP